MLPQSLEPRPELAPRWLVSNGDTTVGPVRTELLLQGYLGGRIPAYCQVRQETWAFWRPLLRTRELSGVRPGLAPEQALPRERLRDAAAKLPLTRDAGELLSLALPLALHALLASSGIVHRYREPVSRPVTSVVCGVSAESLGEVLPGSDPSYLLAVQGRSLVGSPSQGLAERLIAERLQSDAAVLSVAMTPIVVSGRLFALLELGRTDHPFRAEDAADLAEFGAQVARRIG